MRLFNRKPNLMKADVQTLSLEKLDLLQRGLIFKLRIVNDEMRDRCATLADLGDDLEGAEDSLSRLREGAERCVELNRHLTGYLDSN